jgi:nicotinate-nucleotide adenylyltransferase
MSRLGVFGGSFNPIHRGHLYAATLAREAEALDGVVFVPAANPPHKTASDLAPAADRLAMIRAALTDEPGFSVSTVELDPGGPRYTIETLLRLCEEHPGHDLVFILGLDSLVDLPGWREPDRILDTFGVIAVDRPGLDTGAVDPTWRKRVRVVGGNPFAISSTGIRRRVAAGRSIRHLVVAGVEAHIREQGLYRAER